MHDIRRYLSAHSNTPSAEVLARLPATVSREESLPLGDLYKLDWETFQLAIELLRDWRLDRHYAQHIDLFGPTPAESAPDNRAPAPPAESLETAE